MTTRKYSSRSQQTTLTSAVTSGATIIPVANAATLLGGATVSTGQTFTVVIDPDTALEEIVDVTVVSSNNLTVSRATDMAGGTAQDHSAGAVIRHMIIGRDLREANLHIEATTAYNDGTGSHTLHGLGTGDGSVVGTDATQTLTNKTLIAPVLTSTLENDAGITFEGSTADAYETLLTVVDPTADRTITLPNATGTVVLRDTTDTLTNKTLTSPIINGSPVITGLSSAGMSASSAAPKDYVDSILGSATAASTSAASAATSASSALTSQTAAATSATSAAASATAAATSATSAAASATAAATSATSAAASVTTAQAWATQLVTPVSGSDYSAKYNANLAATSATSAAASATAAATSATSASASVSSIAGYATTASNSASAAATSASSAATSASSAATSASSAATTYTAYDARYLGSKSSAPTVDNLGGTLLVGATYWNTATTTMYVWSGSVWNAISTTGYSAPTLGSTTLASGTTYANVAGLTINSTTIPTSKTLVTTTDKISALAATTSAELAGVISDETGSGALVFANAPAMISPTITTATAATKGIVIKATASQSANLQEWQNSGAGVMASVNNVGYISTPGITDVAANGAFLSTTTGGTLTANTRAAGIVGFTVKGSASQTAALQQWQNSTGTVLASVNASGQFVGDGSQLTGITSLPSQTGNTGKYLTTDGSTASWATVTTDPTADIFMMMGA